MFRRYLAMSTASVEQLVAAGKYGDAARVARDAGDHARAAELYERIWDFASAAACARDAGDRGRALRNAIDARDEALVRELAEELRATGDDGVRIALDVFALRRRFADAAALAEQLGDDTRAVDLYKQGHRELDAARLLEAGGRDREAGRLLERLVAHGGTDPELAPAHLQLGLLLARRMQHDDAVRHLQEAGRHRPTRDRARRALIAELAALGLRDAARDVLVQARGDDPDVPAELDEVIRTERDAREPPVDDPEVEMIAGRYRIDRLLGAGGAGRVYLARDEVTGRRVAVKVFNTAHARGREAYERFVREARVAGALRHPNLVEVLDFSAEQGFLVMEYMVGGSLAQRLDPHLPEPKVRRMILDLLAGLELAHRRNIVHRDVKPPNIFFDARGTAKLGDFGVAHLLDLGATQTGGLIGTLAYMSPEQITGAPLTFAADLYALGVTLFQSLTGRLPFLGPDFVAQHLGERPPAPSEVNVDTLPQWDPIVDKLLEKNPADRFESVDELRRAVDSLRHSATVVVKPLLLRRAGTSPLARQASDSFTELPSKPEPSEDEARYHFETLLGRTEISSLRRALDRKLDRSVIIEQYDEDVLDKRTETRLYNLARGGGPFMQRALGYDRDQRLAVFEAPSGAPFSEALADAPPRPRQAARLLKRLARALAPLHNAGAAHGALDATRILIDSLGHPTVLACGLGPVNPDATPASDVKDLVALVCSALRLDNTAAESLVDALASHLSQPEQSALRLMSSPRTGEELYAFADALEIAILKGELRG